MKPKQKKHVVELQMSSTEIEINSDISDNSDTLVCETQPSTSKTFLDISNTAAASIRYGVSTRLDLIEGGHLKGDSSYLAVDKSKVWRAQKR